MTERIDAKLKDRPTRKDFNNHVRNSVTHRWEDLGVQLDITEEKLDEIKANTTDNVERCTEVFKHWCQKYPQKATWETLIEALESPSLELNELAEKIRQKLLSDDANSNEDKTDFHQDISANSNSAAEPQTAVQQNSPTDPPITEAVLETSIVSPQTSSLLISPSRKTDDEDLSDNCDSFNKMKLPPVVMEDSLNIEKDAGSPKKKQKYDDAELCGMLMDPREIEVQLPRDSSIRRYQKELAAPGMEGRNCIIVAPTGTGKTLVACMIISANLKRHGIKGKVLFLVTKIPLANQQCEQLKRDIKGVRVMSVTGENKGAFSLSTLLNTHEIVVCTADLLKNDLQTSNISLKDVSLIVFDECHHCKGRSTYSAIMIEYLKKKIRQGETQLPQIVGLTASPGAGDSRKPDLSKTTEHLMKLTALMDAEAGFVTVKDNVAELLQYTTKTNFTIVPIPGRTFNDNFQALLVKHIRKLDSVIQEVTGKSASHEVTDQGYINFLSGLLQESKLRSEDPEKERNIRSIIEHLQHYTKILQFYFDYEYEDSLSVMLNKLRSPEPDHITQVEKQLQVLFESFHREALQVTKNTNPKLEKLKSLLQENFSSQIANKRAIIFVTEVENATTMKEWIRKQPEFEDSIKVGVVTGHSRQESKGMTQEEQNLVIKAFRGGKLNLLVATSVLEEGFDVPACNLIIRYQHVTNEISLVQSRGRARAVDSKCYAIIGKGTPKEFQELQNEEKNHLVNDVIKSHLPSPSEWLIQLKQIQLSTLETVEMEEKIEMEQRQQHSIDDVHLLCSMCDEVVCYGADLFRDGSHYIAISDTIKAKYKCKEHEKPFIRETTQIRYRIHCNKCDQRWGVENYQPKLGKTFPCISCDKFIFVIKGERHTFKKWKNVPFSVPDMVKQ